MIFYVYFLLGLDLIRLVFLFQATYKILMWLSNAVVLSVQQLEV